MIQGMPWPIAYSALIIAMIIIGIMTFLGLHVLEGNKARSQHAEHFMNSERPTMESR
jgi:hypothetical protein